VFSGIQARVEEFYAKKQLTIANYEALKAVAVAKYDIATEAVEAVKGSVAFDCGSDDPVGTADAFKAKVKVMHSALKDYRSAINALLVAVKTAASGTEGSRQ
jgi:predicted methyltransferase